MYSFLEKSKLHLKFNTFVPTRWHEAHASEIRYFYPVTERRERKAVKSLLEHWLGKLGNINRKKMRFVDVQKCGSRQDCLTFTCTNDCLGPKKLGLFSVIVIGNTEIILTKHWQRQGYAEIKSNLDNHSSFKHIFPSKCKHQKHSSRPQICYSHPFGDIFWSLSPT